MSADLPAGAVTAAAVAIHKRRCNCAIPHRDGWPGHSRLEYEYAEHALEAAAPAIAADVRAQMEHAKAALAGDHEGIREMRGKPTGEMIANALNAGQL